MRSSALITWFRRLSRSFKWCNHSITNASISTCTNHPTSHLRPRASSTHQLDLTSSQRSTFLHKHPNRSHSLLNSSSRSITQISNSNNRPRRRPQVTMKASRPLRVHFRHRSRRTRLLSLCKSSLSPLTRTSRTNSSSNRHLNSISLHQSLSRTNRTYSIHRIHNRLSSRINSSSKSKPQSM